MNRARANTDGILIRRLEEGDNFKAAEAVCWENFTSIVRKHVWINVLSVQYLLFTLLTHFSFVFLFRITDLRSHPIFFLLALATQLSYIIAYFLWMFRRPESGCFEEYWLQNHRRFLVAIDTSLPDHPVVGTIGLERDRENPSIIHVLRLRVISSHLRRGIARRMHEKSEAVARKQVGGRILRVTTTPLREEAICCYSSCGFQFRERTAVTGCYPWIPSERIVFEKNL